MMGKKTQMQNVLPYFSPSMQLGFRADHLLRAEMHTVPGQYGGPDSRTLVLELTTDGAMDIMDQTTGKPSRFAPPQIKRIPMPGPTVEKVIDGDLLDQIQERVQENDDLRARIADLKAIHEEIIRDYEGEIESLKEDLKEAEGKKVWATGGVVSGSKLNYVSFAPAGTPPPAVTTRTNLKTLASNYVDNSGALDDSMNWIKGAVASMEFKHVDPELKKIITGESAS